MMRISRLDLIRYGKFTDYSIDFGARIEGQPDLHIVYGLNEAGKTTALSAYLDLLFGIEQQTRYGFLHPYATMEIGAALEFGGDVHELRRVKQRTNALRDAGGQPVNEALLGTPLAGLTRDAYRMMFSLDDETLEKGGEAILESKGDLGELLFSASAGLADLSRTLEAIDAQADAIFRKRASKTRIAELKRSLDEKKAERERIDVQASAHARLVAELRQAGAAYEEALAALGAAKARHAEIGRLIDAAPLADEYAGLDEELAQLQDLPRPPTHWAADLPHLMADDTRLQTRLMDLDGRIDALDTDVAAIAVDETILSLGDRLERLGDAAGRYRGAEDDLPKRRASLDDVEARTGVLLRALGRPDESEAERLLVPAAVIGSLRDLIERRSGIVGSDASASEELATATMALERARENRDRLAGRASSDDAPRLASLRAILGRLRQGDLSARLRLAERELPRLQRAADEAFAALSPWTGDAALLKALVMPDAARLEEWRRALPLLESRKAAETQRLRELAEQEHEQAARLAALRGEAGGIDDASAGDLRAERDAAWDRHRAAMDKETAAAFEARMRADDALGGLRLARASELAEMRGLAATLSVTRSAIERQQAQLAQTEAQWQAMETAVRDAVPPTLAILGDVPLARQLARIERWSALREKALAAQEGLRAAQDEAATIRQEVSQERARLAQLLSAPGVAIDDLPLDALVEMADAALAGATERIKALEAAEAALRERADELATRRHKAERARADLDTWRASWEAALAGTWFADRREDPAAVRGILDALGELAAVLDKRAELRHRAEAMERDRGAFADELAALLAVLGETLDAGAVLPTAEALAQRYRQAMADWERRKAKEVEREGLVEQRRKLGEERALHAARKVEILTFLDVPDLLAASQALDQCVTRDRLEADRRKLATRIAAQMQAGSIEEALGRLGGLDRDAASRELNERAIGIENLDERARELFAARTTAENKLIAIGGDDAVARIEAERRTLLLDIEDLALTYLRLKTGALMASQALRAYRERHRSAMMNRASEAFRLITRGAYSGLATRQDKDRETLIGLAQGGGSKLASDMSKGTRFQLYLALRVAGYEEFAAVRPSVPFITDDIMETFDEPRSEEVLRLFVRMAGSGQVIYLTHHRHLCDLARQVHPGVRIHEIPS
ncbi:uncharacterized protein YhaN [Kaistia hirudinis]|uniref:Uncharacterized protein YhaN n=1 Tax=Kaistia hirudinis TaxID=1293440 RepID=A0A840AR64_9HYPH|nr:AAA family ATPase [Kaistia hirudinis]MBB3931351.1 uncharacterized protein YhaN [Kaistia hirudinis]